MPESYDSSGINPGQPTGVFRVINDVTGTLAKAAENYYDVLAAKNEATVTPKPAVATPPGTTPGTTSPEAARAAQTTIGGIPMKSILIIGAISLAIGLTVATLLRRK